MARPTRCPRTGARWAWSTCPRRSQAAGIPEPTADWTWEDLQKAAEAIQKTGKYGGFCMGADWARFAPFVFGNGGAYASDDFKTATIDTPEVKQAAHFIADMKKSGALVDAVRPERELVR